jgi:hypothetical protein
MGLGSNSKFNSTRSKRAPKESVWGPGRWVTIPNLVSQVMKRNPKESVWGPGGWVTIPNSKSQE